MPNPAIDELQDALGLGLGTVTRVWSYRAKDWATSVYVADIDNDGDQGLFVTTVRGGNALFENDGQGHFKDITQEAGLTLIAHSSGAFFLTMTTTACSTFWSAVGKYCT